MYIVPSLNSEFLSLRRDDLMAIDMEKTEEQRDYHFALNLRKRCIKRHSEGIHDRFLKDAEFRASQL